MIYVWMQPRSRVDMIATPMGIVSNHESLLYFGAQRAGYKLLLKIDLSIRRGRTHPEG